MKFLSGFVLLLTLTIITSCGDDKKSKSISNIFGSSLSTQEGFYNLQTQALEVGGAIYPPNQQYAVVMNEALNRAQANRVVPVTISGVQKLRARITAQISTNQQGYSNSYQQQPYQQNQNSLILSNVQFY